MKTLIIGPSWIGDMVMAQSLFRYLKAETPKVSIDVLALDWTKDLLERMPEVNRAVTMPIGHGELALGKRWKLGKQLQKENYHQAIVLPNSFKSALVPLFARIPIRTGWKGEARSWILNDCRVLDKKEYPLMVERFAALAFRKETALPESLLRPKLEVSAKQIPSLLKKFGLDLDSEIVIFCPGAEFGAAKKWPEEHFSKTAETLISEGKQVWLMGSKNDEPTGQAIIDMLRPELRQKCINLAGLTSIGEAIDLISLAKVVISNDSGLMHIAAALNTALIVLYGSTSANFTPPLSDKVQVLSMKLSCSPCFQRECPLGHLDCLRKLDPVLVIEAIKKMVQS